MRRKLTESDRGFLKSLAISAEPTFEESRLELAQRIAKHQAPGEPIVQIDPNEARLALIRIALEQSFQQLSPEDQEAARKAIYERMTGKPYRPQSNKKT